MALLDRTVRTYLELASSRSAEVGGGAVAALSAAGAAALLSMVCHLTVGKKRYQRVEDRVRRIGEDARVAREALQEAAVEDGAAYDGYLAASRTAKVSADDESERQLGFAVLRMTEAPLETAQQCLAVLSLAEQLAPIGSARAISDVGASLLMAHAALAAALLTVDINLSYLTEPALEESLESRRDGLESAGLSAFRAGIKSVQDRIRDT